MPDVASPALGMRVLSLADDLHRLLPTGRLLPTSVWQARHRPIVGLLWAYALGIPVFSAVMGHGFSHGLVDAVVVVLTAILASYPRIGRRFQSVIATFGLISCSAIIVHLSDGYIEAHFHFFVVLGVVSLYQDWPPFLLSVAYVIVHHGFMGVLYPDSVYNHPGAVAQPRLGRVFTVALSWLRASRIFRHGSSANVTPSEIP